MFVIRKVCLGLAVTAFIVVASSVAAVAAEAPEHAVAAEPGAVHNTLEEENPNPLVFDPDLAIFTAIVFLALLFVLGKFAWPQISAALAEREQRIEDNIAAAEAKHEEAKQLLAQHEAKLATAADEVRALLEEARRDAERTKEQILVEAKQAADSERDRAVRDIQRAAYNELKSLAETSANLAVDLATQVVRQNITADQQAQLVRDALSKLVITEPSKN